MGQDVNLRASTKALHFYYVPFKADNFYIQQKCCTW